MSEINTTIDSLGVFLTGGVANLDPDLSLGGLASTKTMRGEGSLIDLPLPAIRIDNAWPGNGEGVGVLRIDLNGDLRYTPPGAAEGLPVSIAAAESKVVPGLDRDKAVRVFREGGLAYAASGSMNITFREALNGALAMKDVTDAQRVAGVTTYRALMLQAKGIIAVQDIRIWTPVVVGAQAVYSVGVETPATGGAIQTIADEFTAPGGIVWVTSTTEGGALTIVSLPPGDEIGLWIRKVFPPAGTVVPREDFQLAMKYLGV